MILFLSGLSKYEKYTEIIISIDDMILNFHYILY